MEKPKAPNFAEDEKFTTEFMHRLLNKWRRLQASRAQREDIWQDSYDVWSCGNQDVRQQRNYNGRANIQLPQLRKETETMSRRIVKAMFPEDYLDGDSTRFEEESTVETNVMVLRHYFDNQMKLKSKLMPWVKQGVLFGTSPLRSYWDKKLNEVIYKKRLFKPGPNGIMIPDMKAVKEEVVTYNAPRVRAESMFQVWVYPHNASDVSEIEEVYFRTKLSREDLKKKYDMGVYTDIGDLEDQGRDIDASYDQEQIKLQAMGEDATFVSSSKAGDYYDLLEVWGRAEMPNGDVLPYVCEIINESFCKRLQQNPFWHQSIPFDFMRFIIPPAGEFYGRGLPEASIAIQHQLNDTLNQSMDSVTLALNNITIINPAYAPNSESFEIEPNAVWWADPSAVKQFQFPDLSDTGLKNATALRGIITEMSDNSPQLPDPIAGKARSTGQAQLAINEWQTDLYSFVNQIIIEALQPLAQKVYALIQQNVDDDAIIRVTGKYAGKWIDRPVTPQDIVGNMDFRWQGALQIENQAVKTQQMLNLLKILPGIPPEANIKVKWDEFLYLLFRDGYQIAKPERILDTDKTNESVPSSLENRIIQMGGAVQVSERDDDKAHISDHQQAKAQTKEFYLKANFDKHILAHQQAMDIKKQKAQIQAQMQQLAMAHPQLGQPPGKGPGGPGGRNNPMGNQGQLSESMNPADMMRGMKI